VLPADGTGAHPDWIDRIGSRPLVYVSLGILWRVWRGHEIFKVVLEGLRDIDAEVVLTVGHDLDPVELGPQPATIHVERFLPLGVLLDRCSLVFFHGGSGTLSHFVAHGLPMVILTLGVDQPENAARCAELGVPRSLESEGAVSGLHSWPSAKEAAPRSKLAEHRRIKRDVWSQAGYVPTVRYRSNTSGVGLASR